MTLRTAARLRRRREVQAHQRWLRNVEGHRRWLASDQHRTYLESLLCPLPAEEYMDERSKRGLRQRLAKFLVRFI